MNNQKYKNIPLSIIEDAVGGKTYALEFILSYFHNYILTLSTIAVEDEYGNKNYIVDDDIVSMLEEKLVLGITNKFKIRY